MTAREKFSDLLGKTLTTVKGEVGGETVDFETDTGERFRLYHSQDCCESVEVDDICGDLSDLVGTPILLAEEAESEDVPEGASKCGDSNTWTFYKLRTIKGSVDIRFHGSSNGYYSESVDFAKVS